MHNRWGKPSAYFCNLENRNFTCKIISNIEKEDGRIISDQNEILMEVKEFYEKLYSENNDIEDIDLNLTCDTTNISKLTK